MGSFSVSKDESNKNLAETFVLVQKKTQKTLPEEFQIDEEVDNTELMGDLTLNIIQQKQYKRRKYIPITPDSIPKTTWDVLGFMTILYQIVIIPYMIAFTDPEADQVTTYVDYFVDSFFICDLCKYNLCQYTGISFVTGYYHHGNLVMLKKKVVLNYLKTWFTADLLASFPYNWVL